MALMSARASSSAMLWLAMGSLMAITTTTVQAKVCETSVENGMDNYGESSTYELHALIIFYATTCAQARKLVVVFPNPKLRAEEGGS